MYISIQSLLSALSAFISFYYLVLICELLFLWIGILTRSVHIRKHHRLKGTVPPTWGMLIVLLSLLNSHTIFIYKLIILVFVCCCRCVFFLMMNGPTVYRKSYSDMLWTYMGERSHYS